MTSGKIVTMMSMMKKKREMMVKGKVMDKMDKEEWMTILVSFRMSVATI